jgi:hypothetical protein
MDQCVGKGRRTRSRSLLDPPSPSTATAIPSTSAPEEESAFSRWFRITFTKNRSYDGIEPSDTSKQPLAGSSSNNNNSNSNNNNNSSSASTQDASRASKKASDPPPKVIVQATKFQLRASLSGCAQSSPSSSPIPIPTHTNKCVTDSQEKQVELAQFIADDEQLEDQPHVPLDQYDELQQRGNGDGNDSEQSEVSSASSSDSPKSMAAGTKKRNRSLSEHASPSSTADANTRFGSAVERSAERSGSASSTEAKRKLAEIRRQHAEQQQKQPIADGAAAACSAGRLHIVATVNDRVFQVHVNSQPENLELGGTGEDLIHIVKTYAYRVDVQHPLQSCDVECQLATPLSPKSLASPLSSSISSTSSNSPLPYTAVSTTVPHVISCPTLHTDTRVSSPPPLPTSPSATSPLSSLSCNSLDTIYQLDYTTEIADMRHVCEGDAWVYRLSDLSITSFRPHAMALTTIPTAISWLRCLKRLVLKQHHIKQLPTSIASLNSLVHLTVSHCELKSMSSTHSLTHHSLITSTNSTLGSAIPVNEFAELHALRYLDLSHNELSGLPKTIGQLQQLEEVRVMYCIASYHV